VFYSRLNTVLTFSYLACYDGTRSPLLAQGVD